jgi:hypothetical protein
MKKKLIFLFAVNPIFGQSELGVIAGGSLFKGDVNRKFAFKETHIASGLLFRNYFSSRFSQRFSLVYITLSGSDLRNESLSPKEINYLFRNLSFRTRILEINYMVEKFFRSLEQKNSSPYLFFGAGFIYYNSQAMYAGQWNNLRPLHTEGRSYSSISYNICVGGGWIFKISERYKMAFEIGFRRSGTDYLDDVGGYYPDKANLQQNLNGSLAVNLTDRSGELFTDESLRSYVDQQGGFLVDSYNASGYRINGYGAAGDKRGIPKNKDKYIIYNFTFTSLIGK